MYRSPLQVRIRNETEFEVKSGRVIEICHWFKKREKFPHEELSVAIVSDDEMKRVNRQFHGEKGTTDVLSFDYGDGSAEVLLNPSQHLRQASEFNNTANQEFTENLIHALLHLSGYDHTSDGDDEHLSRQRELMDQISESEPKVVEMTDGINGFDA